MRFIPLHILLGLGAILLPSCTGGRHFEVVAEGPPRNAPQYVVVTKEPQVATLHFPAGIYQFYAIDDAGYYYRAPQQVLEHTSGTSIPLKGGVYVSKRQPGVVRPFVYRSGALTHVGKLKRGTYQFQNEPSIP